MTWHVHELRGCAPVPLARYLKALGVLRVVAEQADPEVRGSWRNDAFQLVTRLSLDELVEFFVTRWEPTPIVTPWNADGGFLGTAPDAAKAVLEAKALPQDGERFGSYLGGIAVASKAVSGLEKSPKDEDKLAVFSRARSQWSDQALDWLDVVVALLPGEDKPRYPALLASGGCDGRFDFGSAFRQRLMLFFGEGKEAAGADKVRAWLRASLTASTEARLSGKSGGQLDPGSTSPVNGGSGFRGDSAVNPWDFLLAFEGTPVLRVAVARRMRTDAVLASSPFAVRGNAAGYASASARDEDGRGEQWMPLWAHAATLTEVRALFAEGRMQTGRKGAASALDAAKAVARLGVTRGITSFERYGYVPRNGQSSLAVPLGRWSVQSNPRVRLLDEVDGWVDRLRMRAREKGAPGSAARDVRRLESAMLEVCRAGALPARWQDLVVLLGEAEDNLGARGKFTAGAGLQPLPPLSLGWLEACEDGSAELRVAVAIGLLGLPPRANDGVKKVLGPIRMHTLPLDGGARWERFKSAESGLAKDPRVVWRGQDLVDDLAAVVVRRVLEGERAGADGMALDGPVPVALADIEAFLRGGLDDRRISALARGFMALARPTNDEAAVIRRRLGRPRAPVQPLFALARLTHLSRAVGVLPPQVDPTIARLLVAGRLAEAIGVSLRRLRASGLAPKVRMGVGSPELARRIAASLALPLADEDLARLAEVLGKPLSSPSAD